MKTVKQTNSPEAIGARKDLQQVRRCVIKIGSALLTENNELPSAAHFDTWVSQVSNLCKQGYECVLVTSGAIASGMQRLGYKERPHALHELQALAAVGQMGLIKRYESAFQKYQLHTAQVLLSHDDLIDRKRYLNARSTLRTLLKMGVVPVVNENDTVSTEELHFGDNDTLAALATNLVEAGVLILLTDQSGLYTKDPRHHADAEMVWEGDAGDPALFTMAGDSGKLGRGGMRSKLVAAKKAARSGAATIIANGREQDVLLNIITGKKVGTFLKPAQGRLVARKQWLAGHVHVKGQLVLDAGAVKVIQASGRSLLPVGVKAVKGRFARGEVVACVDESGQEIARGLVNYDAEEAARIIGHSSDQIESILGYIDEDELIHRDSLVLV